MKKTTRLSTRPKKQGRKILRVEAKSPHILRNLNIMNALDRIRDGILVFDSEMNFIYANARASELLQRTPENLIGKNYWKEFPEAIGTPLAEACERSFDIQTPALFEDFNLRLERWFEIRIYPTSFGLFIYFTDVTERKKSEEAMPQGEKRYKMILTIASEFMFSRQIGSDGKSYHDWTAGAFEAVTGYSLEEFNAHGGWRSIVHPGDLHVDDQDYEKMCGGEPSISEIRIIKKDGTLAWVRVYGFPIFDEQSKAMVGVYGLVQDITKHKLVETELANERLKLRTVIDNLPDAIYVKDMSARKILSNQADLENIGKAEHEVLQKTDWDVFPADVASQFSADDQSILRNGQPIINKEEQLINESGQLRWLVTSKVPLKNEDGQIIGIVGIGHDITERKLAEEQLKEKEHLLLESQRISKLFSGEIEVAIEKYQFPDELYRLYGIPSESFAHTREGVLNLIHPDDRSAINREIKDLLAGKKSSESDFRIILPDKSIRYMHGCCETFFSTDGAPIRVIVTVQDVTERKLAEEEIKKRLADLEAINRIMIALRGASTLDEMLPIILDQTLNTLQTSAGAIWINESYNDHPHQVVSRGWFNRLVEDHILTAEGIAGHVFQTGEAYITHEFINDPLAYNSLIPKPPPGWGGACLPIHFEMETIGVLFVAVQLPRQLGKEDLQLLTTISEMAENAFRRAKLFERTVQQLQRLTALRDIDQAISSILDLRTLLDALLSHITVQLKVDAADILFFDLHDQMLEYKAGRGFLSSRAHDYRERIGDDHLGRAVLERKINGEANINSTSNSSCARIRQISDEGFVAHYAVPLITKGEVKGVMEVFNRSPLSPDAAWLNYLETLAGQVAIAIDNAFLIESLRHTNADLLMAYDATIAGWSRAMDLRDKDTENHTQRVTNMTVRLAERMGIADDQMVHIRRGALLHDIGKLGVPDNILLKPGNLTEEEWVVMRLHPQLAYEMLYPIKYLHPALDIPYCHHEKWDGSGYPRGLKGEEIPLAARIFALVDVYDALTSDRPYRKAWLSGKALDYILEQSGIYFDPKIVSAFYSLLQTGELSKNI